MKNWEIIILIFFILICALWFYLVFRFAIYQQKRMNDVYKNKPNTLKN